MRYPFVQLSLIRLIVKLGALLFPETSCAFWTVEGITSEVPSPGSGTSHRSTTEQIRPLNKRWLLLFLHILLYHPQRLLRHTVQDNYSRESRGLDFGLTYRTLDTFFAHGTRHRHTAWNTDYAFPIHSTVRCLSPPGPNEKGNLQALPAVSLHFATEIFDP